MEEVSGGTLFRGDALGSWEHLRDQEYAARYKFIEHVRTRDQTGGGGTREEEAPH